MKRAYRYAPSTQCAAMPPGRSPSIFMEYLPKDQQAACTCCLRHPRRSYRSSRKT
jgi:hypothetical protein